MKKSVKTFFEQEHIFIVVIVIALIAGAYLLFNYTNFTVVGKAAGVFNTVCVSSADCDAMKGFLCGLIGTQRVCEMAGSNPVDSTCVQDDECQSRTCTSGSCTAPVTGCTTANQATTCPGRICGKRTLFDSVKGIVVPSVTICEPSRINYNFEVCLTNTECQSGLCGKNKAGYRECTRLYSEETGSACVAHKECRSNSCVSGFCAAPTLNTKVCGNGLVERIDSSPEQCDDWNLANGDGCSSTCRIEADYTCSGSPSVCTLGRCGDSVLRSGEECDDGNTVSGDGCTVECMLEISSAPLGVESLNRVEVVTTASLEQLTCNRVCHQENKICVAAFEHHSATNLLEPIKCNQFVLGDSLRCSCY